MITIEIKQDGQLLSIITAEEKQFKTGSRGYYNNAKLAIGDKRYQVQVQMVEIGSKPKAEDE